jgi:(S)-ureidoglycine-glyoxylate aminotransferase
MSDQFSVNPSLLRPFSPPPRLLMGLGPITVDPRLLRAMSAQLVGQYDPAMTQCMNDTMALYRGVFKTHNQWTLLIDGTSRAGIEAVLISLLEPDDKVLVPVFGRFGYLLCEIAERCGAEVHSIHKEWGDVFTPDEIESAIKKVQPKVLTIVQGDTSTTCCSHLISSVKFARVTAFYFIPTRPLPLVAMLLKQISGNWMQCLSGCKNVWAVPPAARQLP